MWHAPLAPTVCIVTTLQTVGLGSRLGLKALFFVWNVVCLPIGGYQGVTFPENHFGAFLAEILSAEMGRGIFMVPCGIAI